MQAQENQRSVTVRSRVELPLEKHGTSCEILTFKNLPDLQEHILLCFGNWSMEEPPLVRIHSECLTGDVFGSAKCDCGPQLDESIKLLRDSGGILAYMRQEGRGIGLYNKLDTYILQASGIDTYAANKQLGFRADERDYSCAAKMLKAVGVTRIKLLSNNPMKQSQLEDHGIQVLDRLPTTTFENIHNRNYLKAKRDKTNHTLELFND